VARVLGRDRAVSATDPSKPDGRAFVHRRRDPDEVVTAIDVASGGILWREKCPAP
jgi:hypothetical protein